MWRQGGGMRERKKGEKSEREQERERDLYQAVYCPYHQSFTGEQDVYNMFCINKRILQIFSKTQQQQQQQQNIITNN